MQSNEALIEDRYRPIIIDAHQHFWQYNKHRDGWIDDNMKVLQRDFLPADLQPILTENNVVGCVAVQADQSLKENELLLDIAANNPFVLGVVGWVDLQHEAIDEQLKDFTGNQKMKGFRHILQGEAQRDLMLTPAFKNGIRSLRKHDFSYDVLVYQDQLGFALELVRSFPGQLFVLDHLGKPPIKTGEYLQWKRDIENLGKCENVYCKISGLVTEAEWSGWTPNQLQPYIDVVVAAFGMKRIMYGSDWPVCLLAATYEQVLQVCLRYFNYFTKHENDCFFGLNAQHFYRLQPI